MRDWEKLYEKIGPLRYQASSSDCVPTAIINGLMVLLEDRLHPKLHQLIWAIAGDQDKNGGTGWVCCDTLALLLNKWFQRAHQDKRAKEPLPFTSQIIEGNKEVNLNKTGALLRCINGGGVACLVTGKNADHYSLLLGVDEHGFLGFDSWWDGKKAARELENFAPYKGLVNVRWTPSKLKDALADSGWVHLMGHVERPS